MPWLITCLKIRGLEKLCFYFQLIKIDIRLKNYVKCDAQHTFKPIFNLKSLNLNLQFFWLFPVMFTNEVLLQTNL